MTARELIVHLSKNPDLEVTVYQHYNGHVCEVGEVEILPADFKERPTLPSDQHNDKDKIIVLR